MPMFLQCNRYQIRQKYQGIRYTITSLCYTVSLPHTPQRIKNFFYNSYKFMNAATRTFTYIIYLKLFLLFRTLTFFSDLKSGTKWEGKGQRRQMETLVRPVAR